MRHSLRSCLEGNFHWNVCGEAGNGREAVEKVHQLNPDLVILDFSMPLMNGLEAARELKRIRPGLVVLMFTTFKTAELEKEAISAGCVAVISKSNVELLSQSIQHLLAA